MKVLIFLEKNKLAPKGGPYGYVYNLIKGLKRSGREEIQIDTLTLSTEDKILSRTSFFRKIEKKAKYLNPYPEDYFEILNEYDVIHFHVSRHMYKARNFLSNYKGLVLFTSHSPELYSDEVRKDASKISQILCKHFYEKISIMDDYAFARADHIIFPCEESEEPYAQYDGFVAAKEQGKILYMTSGTFDCTEKPLIDRHKYREKYNIPDEAFVVSYVGRHNWIKGYDRLLKTGKEILKNKNIYYLVAGKQTSLYKSKSDRWIEIGFTNDPHSLINASDLLVLPNRQTYFDLIFLEVLSLNKMILASNTGGNKYFHKYGTKDILLFDTDEEMVDIILRIASKKNVDCCKNREIYIEEFTCEKFAERYYQLLLDIKQLYKI